MDLPEELEALHRFHGHLGVYVTVGLRMGSIGKRILGPYRGLHASVRSRSDPPMRCVVDGIQFSSGCTMGKGNIVLEPADEPEVLFTKEARRLRIRLKPGWRERIDREMSKEREIEQSRFFYDLPEADLFDLVEG
jgi:formylmethanofuran dehydrogenase subunit E